MFLAQIQVTPQGKPSGVLNCCLNTIREASRAHTTEPAPGEVLQCEACGECVIARNGIWEWLPCEQRPR